MSEFFQAISDGKRNGPMLAAWVIEGSAAGSRALFGYGETGYTQQYRDEAFPADIADEIRGMPPEKAGIFESKGNRVFLDRIPGKRKLVRCGAGHVALAVIRICAMLDFEITAIEDREEYAQKAREAGAHHVICQPFGEALDGIPGDWSTAFVIMTREHQYDMECLRRILRKTYAYAGMMGSRSRTDQIRERMLEEGYDSRKVAELHMPIGLAIGSRTPEEIAVSVAAELIRIINEADCGEGFPEGMAEELAEQPRGVLAMIVEKHGEAPRKPGTKMLVREDGSFRGTVGGRTAEAAMLRTAEKMIRDGERDSRLIRIAMKEGTMYCGGDLTVFLLPLGGNEA